jgi:hypothetical protein
VIPQSLLRYIQCSTTEDSREHIDFEMFQMGIFLKCVIYFPTFKIKIFAQSNS